MNDSSTPDIRDLHQWMQQDGFVFVDGTAMRSMLEATTALEDWARFAASWNDLGPDNYLAASGRKRRRRHAVFSMSTTGSARREPHQPHYQSRTYNPLQGGIERWFEPLLPTTDGTTLQRILGFGRDVFGALAPAARHWHVEVHQFRIEARADQAGEPTPEGVHRDGVDYVLVLMIDRENIESGTTTIHAPDGARLGNFTLTHPFDAALVDDHRVSHGVTPVRPRNVTRPSHRDVLVVTFKASEPPRHESA